MDSVIEMCSSFIVVNFPVSGSAARAGEQTRFVRTGWAMSRAKKLTFCKSTVRQTQGWYTCTDGSRGLQARTLASHLGSYRRQQLTDAKSSFVTPNFLKLSANPLGASNTLTTFSSAPLTNRNRPRKATQVISYPWICGRPISAQVVMSDLLQGACARVVRSVLVSVGPSTKKRNATRNLWLTSRTANTPLLDPRRHPSQHFDVPSGQFPEPTLHPPYCPHLISIY